RHRYVQRAPTSAILETDWRTQTAHTVFTLYDISNRRLSAMNDRDALDNTFHTASVFTLGTMGNSNMQLIKPLAGALSALSVLALSGHPAGATTPVSGGLNAVANSTINSTTATDLQNFSWSAIPAPLSTSVLAT